MVNEAENEVVFAFSYTIPSITVTIEFGDGHGAYAQGVAEAAKSIDKPVAMEVNGTTLTYKVEKGKSVHFVVVDQLRDAISDYTNTAGVYDNNQMLNDAFFPQGTYNLKPMSEYASAEEWEAEADALSDIREQNEDITLYIQWRDRTDVTVAITSPVCGTEVTIDPSTGPDVIPEIEVVSGKASMMDDYPCYWMDLSDPARPFKFFEGEFIGEEEYTAVTIVAPDFGYYIDYDQITIENGERVKVQSVFPMDAYLFIKTEAVHDMGDPVETKAATCTEPGEAVRTCKGNCGKETTEEIKPLGHDWGDWQVTKEPTETEEGEEKRTCSRCGEEETRAIPKIDVAVYNNTKGDEQQWVKGSYTAASFTFKRSVEDEKTFELFTGIEVDGAVVDPSNYTAREGSVIIDLKPSYLETLALGKHTIRANFEDGYAEADFYIVAKEADKKVTPSTSDEHNIFLWLLGVILMTMLVYGEIYIRRGYSQE